MITNCTMVATKSLDKAPTGYYPKHVFIGLYRADKPSLSGKIYFISVDKTLSKTWLSKEHVVMWLREEGVEIVGGISISELFAGSGDTK